jgi:AcrR family transcriptional regulator
VTGVPGNAERRRPGRPPGSSDTRERILLSARELFARNGLDKTSVRAVAAAAGVDAALVHHYFGTKQQLFLAAIRVPIDPMQIIGPLREAPVDELGLTLPSLVLSLWDSELGAGLMATLRSALAGAEIGLVRTFLREVVIVELANRVDDPAGTGVLRAEFVASQLLGVAMARYILQLEPFASLPIEQIVRTIAPNLQRYLTGDPPGR